MSIIEISEKQTKKQLSFSIVIPCYNEKHYIKNCINSIFKQKYPQNLIEIIIVDGFSNDGTRQIIQDLMISNTNIKLLDNKFRKTPQALNIGIKNSTKELVVILGAHAELDENFIALNNKFQLEKNVKVTGGTQTNLGKNFTQKLIGITMQLPFAMASAKYRWSNKEQYVDTVVYAAYRRELFDELGFFEENFTISEDAEFNWRVRQKGYKIFYSPEIKSYYYPRESVASFVKQIFRYGILRVNVLKKHFDSLKLFHIIPPIFVIVLFTLIVLTILNPQKFSWLILFLVFYFLINILSSVSKIKSKNIAYYFIVPFLIFLMHLSWGTGFLIGLFLPKSNEY